MSEPALPNVCWPVDWSCTPLDLASEDTDLENVARAGALAASSLRALTGYQIGGCPIVVRPCAARCMQVPANWVYDNGVWMAPYVGYNGRWVNACGCTATCHCGSLSEIILPGPVGRVDEVEIDGVLLPEDAYRVDDGNRLVRLDGEQWPVCQDMTADPGTEGAFTVQYLRGVAPDGLAAIAAGRLAWEFYQACIGGTCQLPTNVVAITRQGVSMEMGVGVFPNNVTGIPMVDAWLRTVNPYAITVASTVSSPDTRRPRQTTWRPL